MNRYNQIIIGLLLPLLVLLQACTRPNTSITEQPAAVEQTRQLSEQQIDTGCSYSEFIKGTRAEYFQRFEQALHHYQQALRCDPTADYIKDKLPLLQLKMGNLDQATVLLKQKLKTDPQNTYLRLLLARIFIQQQDRVSAIAQLTKVLEHEPDHEQALLRTGVLYSQRGSIDRALPFFKRLIEINEQNYFAHLYLARIFDRKHSPETAAVHYTNALELNWSTDLVLESAEFFLRQKNYPAAERIVRNGLEEHDADDDRLQISLAQILLAAGKEKDALEHLKQIQVTDGEPSKIDLILCRLYVKNNRSSEAETCLKSILENGDNAEARYLLALLYLDRDDSENALKLLANISPDQKEFEDAIILRSRILQQTNQTKPARTMLEAYTQSERTRKPIFYVLRATFARDDQDDREAEAVLRDGLKRYPDNEKLTFELGLQLERVGKLEEAIVLMQQLIKKNPLHAEALNFVGYSWADTDRNLEQALTYIVKAMELKPNNGYIQDSLGWVHFKLGNLDRARQELQEALILVPEDPHIHDHLGDVLLAMGDKDQALKAYQTAFDLFEEGEKKERVKEKISDLKERSNETPHTDS
ncbi:MAG: hypothetical protein D6B25_00345 [Desulfobulbaceae bacterium]|nr:MAG: hypothetical protein D6B25_00345 [Desulfobulbaceae bacterium]